MPDHLPHIGIMLSLIFCAEIRERLFKRASLGENSVDEIAHDGWRFSGADRDAQHLAPAIAVDRHRNDHSDRDDTPLLANLHVGRVEPQVGPVALQRAATLSSISPHKRLTWLLEMPVMPIAWTRSSTERVDTPWT